MLLPEGKTISLVVDHVLSLSQVLDVAQAGFELTEVLLSACVSIFG